MPVRPLPTRVVNRLRKPEVANEIDENLEKYRRIDDRYSDDVVREAAQNEGLRESETFGGRARVLHPKGHPRYGIVIKRPEGASGKPMGAYQTLRILHKWIDAHNRNKKPKTYRIVKPNVYAINDRLIAMSKTRKFTIHEILKQDVGTRTKARRLNEMKVSKQDIEDAYDELMMRLPYENFGEQNLLVLGKKKGKVILMPLPDLY